MEREKFVQNQIDTLELKCASQYHSVNTLSGGNKQKVVFGKWIGSEADVLILDCPTRGIDIGVKASMYQLIYKMKNRANQLFLLVKSFQN